LRAAARGADLPTVSETPALAAYFDIKGETLALIIIGYGFVASVLPVWLLLAPRDYLSTFLKIGTIALLAVGIIIVRPDLQMPAVTNFIDGSGPVWAGSVFPFLFITIACGAVSGWHSLIASRGHVLRHAANWDRSGAD
jgi:carbon starvation protein